MELVREKSSGGSRKTWKECVKDDMDELGLQPEWAVFRDMWRGFISGQTSDPSRLWKKYKFKKYMRMMMMMIVYISTT